MTRLEEQLKHLKTITLPREDRARMRAELLAYADMHTVRPAILSPFTSFFSVRMYAGFAAFLLIIGSVGGTAYAAEGSLPGDVLYSVKLGVTEPIQTALIPSDTGKAAWHAILAERRLEEAALLASENRLSTDTQATLAANFNEHVEASLVSAERLEGEGNALASLSVRSDLEARIAAHQQILGVIAGHYASADAEGTQDTNMSLQALLAVVQGHEERLATSRVMLADAIAPQASTTATIAIATSAKMEETAPAFTMSARMSAEAQVEQANTARTMEIESILADNASLLAKFLPNATTTATSTEATSTDPVLEAPEAEAEAESAVKSEDKVKIKP